MYEDNDYPEPTYCSAQDVAETLGLEDPINPSSLFMFSDVSVPTISRVEKMILSAEEEIDRRVRKSWRENRVKNKMMSINIPQWDENGWRSAYYQQGGYIIQLRADVRPWDPSKGDRLELRTRLNQWIDISEGLSPNNDVIVDGFGGGQLFWMDEPNGRLFLRVGMLVQKFNAIRISYRYGSEEPVPMGINRLCCLIVASNVLTMDFYAVKVGSGGDLSGIRDLALKRWKEEINELYTAYQMAGSVHSLLR